MVKCFRNLLLISISIAIQPSSVFATVFNGTANLTFVGVATDEFESSSEEINATNTNLTDVEGLSELDPGVELAEPMPKNCSTLENNTAEIIENVIIIKKLEAERDELRRQNEELQSKIYHWMKNKGETMSFLTKYVMIDPVVKLYSMENYTGQVEEFDFGAADKAGVTCQNQWYWRFPLRSVDTLGKCIRLFRHPSCKGLSVAIYPGSGNSQNVLTDEMRQIQSIGRCLENEIVFDEEKNTYVKNASYLPDMVEFYSWNKYLNQTPVLNSGHCTQNNTPSILSYVLGPNQRLEFIEAWICPHHTIIASVSLNNSEANGIFSDGFLQKEAGDIVGYGIPPEIGGPENETYNIFAQTLSSQREWLRVISGIRHFVKQYDNPVHMALNFQHSNNDTSRPDSFYYYIEYRFGSFKHEYGWILN